MKGIIAVFAMIFVGLLKELYWLQTSVGKFQELKATGSVAAMKVAAATEVAFTGLVTLPVCFVYIIIVYLN